MLKEQKECITIHYSLKYYGQLILELSRKQIHGILRIKQSDVYVEEGGMLKLQKKTTYGYWNRRSKTVMKGQESFLWMHVSCEREISVHECSNEADWILLCSSIIFFAALHLIYFCT
jgi:hypothetical protein